MALKRMTAVLGLALTALAPPAVGFTMRDRLLSPAIVPVPDTAAPAGPDAMLPARSAAIVRDVAPVDENPALYQPVAGWDYNPSDLNGGSSGFPLSALTVNQTLGRAR